MSDIDPKKLKVAELREELKQRGLDTKGNKGQLVKRLTDFLSEEAGEEAVDETLSASVLETTTEEHGESDTEKAEAAVVQEEPAAPEVEPEPEPEPEPQAEIQEEAPQAEPEPEPEQEAAVETAEVVQLDAEPEKEIEKEEAPTADTTQAETTKADTTEADKTEADKTEADKTEAEEAAPEAMEEGDEGIPLEGEFQVMDSVGDTDGIEGDDDKRGEKRRRSRSRDRDRHSRMEQQKEPDEPEDWIEATNVQLDRYNCDLNLRIGKDGFKATPITTEGFAFMWSGARSNYGVNKGKVAFECKILQQLSVDHLGSEETSKHVVRVGFSSDDTSTQLGEEPFSYGYGGTAKASTDCKFQDYGQTFANDDVITAYVDFEGEKIEISYAKNGEDLGKCFDVEKDSFGERTMFPHVLTKNCEFECNFGEKEEPFFPLKEGFVFTNSVDVEERIRGMTPPAKKEDCEIIMMCGLPGAGKTVWAGKHAKENHDKRFNILGTNNIIDKMKVMGLPRKKNYSGRWDVLIDKSTRCLNIMLEMASKRKRNYILDQTNVYPSAQRRKMRPFEGFQRKAIVLVPTDEEYKSRCEKREKEEGKEVPDSAVLEMKANFSLPEEGHLFDKVEFIEQEKDEAVKLVEKYNKEGRDALPPPDKRYRDNRFSGGRDYNNRDNRYNSRGGGYRGGGYGGSRGYNDRRGGYDNRRGASYMGYSNNDRRRYDDKDKRDRGGRSSNYDNRRSGGSNWNKSGGGGWGNQGSWGNQGGWGGNQGSWGNQGQWGGQNYQGNWGGQWGGYNQQGQQGWGQNYNYNWPQGSWGGYNQGQGGSWGSGYNNYQK